MWDESYDELVNNDARRDAVIDILNHIEPCKHTTETQRRLEHNHRLFFDKEQVRAGIIRDIINPIIEYA